MLGTLLITIRDSAQLSSLRGTAFTEGAFERLSYISVIFSYVCDAAESDHICPSVCMEHLGSLICEIFCWFFPKAGRELNFG